jgi:hypothetical protein
MEDKKHPYILSRFHHILWILLSFLALFLSALIYIACRPSEHVFFRWINSTGLEYWFNLVRQNPLSPSSVLPEWFVFSLPDGLWAFAYSLLITGIWSGSKSRIKYFWMASIPILVFGFEFLQYAGNIPGTFSSQDLIFGVAGILIGFFTGTKKKTYEKEII